MRLKYLVMGGVAAASLVFVGYDCFAGGGGIGSQPEGSTYTTHKNFQKFAWHGDGRYGTDWTMTGHFSWSTGEQQVFTKNESEIFGGEMCSPPDTGWVEDFHELQWNRDSPHSESNEGGYHTRDIFQPWSCYNGHALYWDWSWEWANTNPPAEGGGFDWKCTILQGFDGGTYVPAPCS